MYWLGCCVGSTSDKVGIANGLLCREYLSLWIQEPFLFNEVLLHWYCLKFSCVSPDVTIYSFMCRKAKMSRWGMDRYRYTHTRISFSLEDFQFYLLVKQFKNSCQREKEKGVE